MVYDHLGFRFEIGIKSQDMWVDYRIWGYFRDVLVCLVCESLSNRSEMHICMSNCLWSWHILTSRGRTHMFLAWSQIFLLLWIPNRLSVFHVGFYISLHGFKPWDAWWDVYDETVIYVFINDFQTVRNWVSILLPLSQPFRIVLTSKE